ncbi:MAG: general secretion pathway protein GspK [Bdellovibrionales bacterium]|nr:general secretion pathway protein GspK [Bdellovibrionales bacterium]
MINHCNHHTERGSVAMILTLISIAIIAVVAIDMNYRSQVSAKIVANRRDYIKAYELARAAYRWSVFRLQLDANLDKIPAIPGTNYGGKKDDLMEIQWSMPMPYPLPTLTTTFESQTTTSIDGTFMSIITDESAKININDVGSGGLETTRRVWSGASEVLENLLLLPRFQAHLVRKDHREILWAIEDWIDVDSVVNKLRGGTEDLEYRIDDVDYNVKNGPLYTKDEIRLLKPIDKSLFDELAPFVTVYPFNINLPYIWTQKPNELGRININTAPMEIIASVLSRQALPDVRARLLCAQNFVKSRDTIVYRAVRGGEPSLMSFLQKTCSTPSDPNTNNPIITKMVESILSVSSDVFSIEAVGSVGSAEKTIHAVVSRKDASQPKLQYWKVL